MKATVEEYLDLNVVHISKKERVSLSYNEAIESELVQVARNGYPYEIAGFLLGKKSDNSEFVSELYPVDNVAKEQERKFEIHGLDYLKAEAYALENKLDVIGIYHSHPDYPAIPSKHDLEFAQSVFAYAIVSVDGNGDTLINSWKKLNKKFIQQSITIRS
ncbi:MAG: M67 family metallopeptidase [Crocinitomicaceae bacterium]